MKSKIYQQLNYWLGVMALGIVLGLSIQYVSAWTNPSSTAPNGNVGAPLNTGSSDQSKSGGGIAVYGNTYGLYGSGSSYGILGQDSTSGEGSHAYLGYGGYGSVSVGSSIGAYGQGPNHGVQGYNSSYGSGGILGYYNQGVYGYGSAYGVNGYNSSYGSQGILGYYGTGGYFYGTTGVYAQNSWGYYAYLGYPSSSWGVYSNGAIGGTIYYDSNDTGYYVDPNYVSNMAYVYAQWIADSNNTNYYIDPNGTSVLNVVYSNNYMQAPIYYDDDSNYYVNSNSNSRMYAVYVDGLHSYGNIGANGYVASSWYLSAPWLCLNGDCRSSWPSSGVSGSGTTNYLPIWTGGTSLGNSNIAQDGQGSIYLKGMVYVGTQQDYSIRAGDNSAWLAFRSRSNKTVIKPSIYGFSITGDSGTNFLDINDSGNVSIAKNFSVSGSITGSGDITANNVVKANSYMWSYWGYWTDKYSNWTTSDERKKMNISTLENSLGKLQNLRGVNFEWKDQVTQGKLTSKGNQIGVIAQEVEKVFPELVKENPETGYKAVSYEGFAPILIQAVKELKGEKDQDVQELKAENEDLKTKNDELQRQLNSLGDRVKVLEENR